MTKKYKMHVISGTHWDREWRHTAEQSKFRLVELVDKIIDVLEKKESYKSFCLDGGMVVIEDYLTAKPQNKEKLKELVKAGRIHLQNWFTLPDMFTVAPEAIIRNLLLGQKMAAEYGGAMKSGYTPTSYGQTSQLPQLYKGFGINNAIFYRGTTKYLLKPLFRWQGMDGTEIHMLRTFDEVTRTNWFFYVHQPLVAGKKPADLQYYYNADHKPVHTCDESLYLRGFKLLKEKPHFDNDTETMKQVFDGLINQAEPYAVGNNLLALNMEDNDVPFILLPDMIEALNAVSDKVELVQSSLDEYMQTITSSPDLRQLPLHRGELRHTAVGYGFNGLLGATHSSRIKLKILNDKSETGLLFHAEPLAAFSAMLGFEYPKTMFERAWRHLLLNQAHDSICGAAVDKAHEDMLYNFSLSKTVADEIAARSIISIYSKIDTASVFEPSDQVITVFNTLPFDRRRIMQIAIDLYKSSGSGGIVDPCTGVGAVSNNIEYYDIFDEKGNEIEYKVLSKENINIAVERELDTNGIKMPAVRHRLLINADAPGLGYKSFALRPRGPKLVPNPQPGEDRKLLAREDGTLENEFLKVTINPNGTFSLLSKINGCLFENLHYFTDNGEFGSAHLSRNPQRDFVETSLGSSAKIRMVESNLLRGIYKIDINLTVPAAATLDGRDRLREESVIPITTWLTVEKNCEYLKLKTRINNHARDHRLRVNFPSNIKTDYAIVESAYAVEQRCIRWTETKDNFEGHYPFQPMQNFVDVSDGKNGLAVLNKGLREYEIKDDYKRTIAITLLRTHRAYMTANTDMTPDEFDEYTGLHCFGAQDYEYALYPHKSNWEKGCVLQKAYDFKIGFNAIHGVPMEGELPVTDSFIKIKDGRLMLSALKIAEDGKGYILRLWNNSNENIKTVVETKLNIKSAAYMELNERFILEIEVDNSKFELQSGPHKITTILLRTGN